MFHRHFAHLHAAIWFYAIPPTIKEDTIVMNINYRVQRPRIWSTNFSPAIYAGD